MVCLHLWTFMGDVRFQIDPENPQLEVRGFFTGDIDRYYMILKLIKNLSITAVSLTPDSNFI